MEWHRFVTCLLDDPRSSNL